MSPAKTVTAQKKELPRRRASGKTSPKSVSTVEQDAINDIMGQGLASPVNLIKDGFLNPDAFIAARGSDDFPEPAESLRIKRAFSDWYHRKSGRSGSVTWEFGWAIVADYGTHENQSLKVSDLHQRIRQGWRPVNREICGPQFSDSLRMTIGLEWFDEGLLAWPGRGGQEEWHVLIVKPKYLKEQEMEVRSQEYLQSIAPIEDSADVAAAEPYVQERKHRTMKVDPEGRSEISSGRADIDVEAERFADEFAGDDE